MVLVVREKEGYVGPTRYSFSVTKRRYYSIDKKTFTLSLTQQLNHLLCLFKLCESQHLSKCYVRKTFLSQ